MHGAEVLVLAASFSNTISARWAGVTPVLLDADHTTPSFELDDFNAKANARFVRHCLGTSDRANISS